MAHQREARTRVSDALDSNTLNAVVGIAGLAIPAAGWAVAHVAPWQVVIAQTVLILILVAGRLWSNRTHIRLRRTNSIEAMDDTPFYDAIRSRLERTLTSDYRGIADGHLSVFAGEVPRLSVTLIDTLIDIASRPERILAADRTTNPSLLTQRRDYLNANRRFIEKGGRIDRLFIVKRDRLLDRDFARDLLNLIAHHRQLGVICGLAVRERLSPQEAVDAVVFAHAAVLIEDEQGDAAYTEGRSTVHFKNIDTYIRRFTHAWEQGVGAPTALTAYENAVVSLLDAWDERQVSAIVDAL